MPIFGVINLKRLSNLLVRSTEFPRRLVLAMILATLMVALVSCSVPPSDAEVFASEFDEMIEEERSAHPQDGSLKSDYVFFGSMNDRCLSHSSVRKKLSAAFTSLAEYYEDGHNRIREVIDANNELEKNGGLDFSLFLNDPRILLLQAHRARIVEAHSSMDRLHSYMDDAPQKFRKSLNLKINDTAFVDEAVQAFESATTSSRIREIRRADQQFMQAAEESFQLLIDAWGGWEFNPNSGGVAFQGPDDSERWGELMKTMAEAYRVSTQ